MISGNDDTNQSIYTKVCDKINSRGFHSVVSGAFCTSHFEGEEDT